MSNERKIESKVTVCLTACGRPDLLEKTLDSFFKYNTYPIEGFYIYEDSGTDCNTALEEKYTEIIWLKNERGKRIGQIKAIDILYSHVNTDYIFHCEEDWEFYDYGFIEKSIDILHRNKVEGDGKMMMVWLRDIKDFPQHPITWEKDYGIIHKNKNGMWGGFSFNPALRRKCDYDRLAPFGTKVIFNKRMAWQSEVQIGRLYYRYGYYSGILPKGYVRHIGDGRHVN